MFFVFCRRLNSNGRDIFFSAYAYRTVMKSLRPDICRAPAPASQPAETTSTGSGDMNEAARMATSIKGSELELFVYEKVGLGNGNYSNNPWLMELPDPISRANLG